jgi:cytochrome bd-type quinol oxidase subunit 1
MTSIGTTSTAGSVLGVLLYLVLVAIGLGSTVLATVFAYRRLVNRGMHGASLIVVTTGACILLFLGLWLVFDIWWVGNALIGSGRRASREIQ